jgi:uncharacterized small protein (TIGR04563 family)
VDKTDKLKQSLYFPKDMLEEIHREAQRLDRSLSWIVQRAWKVAKRDVQLMPGDPAIPDRERPKSRN